MDKWNVVVHSDKISNAKTDKDLKIYTIVSVD